MCNYKILKILDAFKLPVTFYLNRRNKKKDKKIFTPTLGSLYGFWLTVIMGLIMVIYLIYLIDEGIIEGKMDKYNSYDLDNDYKDHYAVANISSG